MRIQSFNYLNEIYVRDCKKSQARMSLGSLSDIHVHYKVDKLVGATLSILGIGVFLNIQGRDCEACKPLPF